MTLSLQVVQYMRIIDILLGNVLIFMPKKKVTKKAGKTVKKQKALQKNITHKKVSKPKHTESQAGLVPMGDRVLVSVMEEDNVQKTESGIYIPESAYDTKKDTKRGHVVAVGNGRMVDGKHVALSVEKGDLILFQWGEEVSYKGSDYMLVNESNILAVIRA